MVRKAKKLAEEVGPYVIIGYGSARFSSTFKGLPPTPTQFTLKRMKANALIARVPVGRPLGRHRAESV